MDVRIGTDHKELKRTKPWSMTQLKARTTSSIGTGEFIVRSRVNASGRELPSVVISAVGKDYINVVGL